MHRLMRIGLWITVSCLALSAACGGTSHPGTIDIHYGDLPVQDVADVLADVTEGTRDVVQEELAPAQHRFEILLLHDTSAPISALAGELFTVRAKVMDYAQGVPAAGITVHYAITAVVDADGNAVDQFDGMFESEELQADTDGFAKNGFRTVKDCGITYTLELSLPGQDAEPKSLDLIVPCAACGCANVKLSYDGALPASSLVDIDVYVLPEAYTCDSLQDGTPAPVDSIIADRNIGNLYGTTSFDCIPAGSYYTLYGLGHRAGSPCVVTYGCNEGMFLKPDTCTDQTLKMYLLTLNPTGKYDCTDHFDFTNLVKQCAGGDTTLISCATGASDLGKTVCCVLSELIKFFTNPGLTLIETIQTLAEQWIGSLIVDTVFNLFKDAVAKIVTNWILNSSPSWLQDFFKIGGDMIKTITHLEMLSDLRLSKLNNNFTMQGDQYWHGLVLYWKFGCDPADPNYATCGRIPLDLDSLNDPMFPTTLLGGKFTAILADFDKLIINQHAIKLNYGELVLYVLDDIIISGITGGKAHSLKEVAHLWLDCSGISTGILGQIASVFGGSAQDIENICNTAVDFVTGFATSWIDNLSLDTEMSINGNAQLVDSNCDNLVEKITKGVNTGFIQGNSTQAAITGDFECIHQ